jgi:hypothetical protein
MTANGGCMASHFSSIGIPLKNSADMVKLVAKASKKGEKLFCEHGHYSKWSSKTGAELWIHVDKSNKILGVNPFLNGESIFCAGITGKIKNENYNDFEGLFYAWANPCEDDPESGDYPFAFDCVNSSIVKDFKLPCVRKIKLSAFPHELTVYSSEDDYHSKQKEEHHLAAKSFIPYGLFPQNENEPHEIVPEAVITGIILEHKKLKNELTNKKYYRITIETYGGIIEAASDPELIKTDLKINGVISGYFYLCGKILD